MARFESESEAEPDQQQEQPRCERATFHTIHHVQVRSSALGPRREERRTVQATAQCSGQRVEGIGDDRPVERSRNHVRLFETPGIVLVGEEHGRENGSGPDENRTATAGGGAEGVEERRKSVQYSSTRERDLKPVGFQIRPDRFRMMIKNVEFRLSHT